MPDILNLTAAEPGQLLFQAAAGVPGPKGDQGEPGTIRGIADVMDFGAVGDGEKDDSDALIAAAASVAFTGGTVRLGRSHKITKTITINTSNVYFEGAGANFVHDVGSVGQQPQTRVLWHGAPGEPMFVWASPEGVSAQKIYGGGLKRVTVDCRGVAGYSVQQKSVNGFELKDIYLRNATIGSILQKSVATLGEAPNCQHFSFRRITIDQLNSTGTGWILDGVGEGVAVGNTSVAYDICDIAILYKDGIGIDFIDADTLYMNGLRLYRDPGGTGLPYIFRGGDAATSGRCARAITLDYVACAVAGYVEGTASRDVAAHAIQVLNLNKENGSVPPTIEAGAEVTYSYDTGVVSEVRALRAGFAAHVGYFNSSGQYTILRAAYPNAAQIIIGSSEEETIRAIGDGSQVWREYISSSDGSWNINKLVGGAALVKLPSLQLSSTLRLANNVNIVGRNSTDTADISAIKVSSDNTVQIRDGLISVGASLALFTVPAFFQNTGVRVYDTDSSHVLSIEPGSNLSANRSLSLITGDASRTITLSGNPTLADWFDQSVKSAASPTFDSLTISTAITLPNTGLRLMDTDASHYLALSPGSNITANRTLTVTTGDADRTLTLNGNATLSDWFDQSVKTGANPTFVSQILTGGLCVGFSGTNVAGQIQVSDANLKLDYGITAANAVVLQFDTNDSLFFNRSTNQCHVFIGGASRFEVSASATTDDTYLAIYDVTGASRKRVSRGAADSGGTGYRMLRIPN